MSFYMDKQRLIRNGAFVGICVVAVGLALGYGRHLMRMDPFARFNHPQPTPQSILARMKDVDMVQYEKDKLVGQAHVGELAIRQDQQTFDLSKVTNGVLVTDEGKVNFNADSATWNANRLVLEVRNGADVSNKDFDLHVNSFSLNQRSGLLRVPREIRGKFFGGQISAREFIYNVNTKNGTLGPSTWSGKPDLQDEGGGKNTKWTFQTNGAVLSRGEIETWNQATATDGEVIIEAKEIQRNKKTDVITATGDCLYFSAKADMACDKVVVYRKEKRAVLTGNVRMLIKPKDDMQKEVKVDRGEIPVFRPEVPAEVAATAPLQGRNDEDKALDEEVRSGKTTRKYPTVVLATRVEYWYAKGNRHANVTGDPQATQTLAGNRWRRVWATTALYDGEKDTVTLKRGDKAEIQMKNSYGDNIMARTFRFSTQENNEDWDAEGMRGDVMADTSEETGSSEGGASSPPITNSPPPADKPKATDEKQKKPGD
jgi:hypothetical protein